MTLLLFGDGDLARPLVEYRLDPSRNKTWNLWHCRLREEEIGAARYYGYSIDGPRAAGPGDWHAYDPGKVLLDPYAKDIYFPPSFDREAAKRPGPNAGKAPLGVLPRVEPAFDWGDDRRPRHESDAVIYEMHVRGFTNSPTSGVSAGKRGTYAGVVEKIPYLKELGVTAVELLPVQEHDPQEANYWGYMTLNFFAPHRPYAAEPDDVRDEFRAMVKALHEADIEVILDVVYNHTAEADETGPTYSFKGIDNVAYYLMSDDPRSPYRDYSGTGNTLDCSSGHVRTMILDSLRYWVTEMHVDGFRFDLASALDPGHRGRDRRGRRPAADGDPHRPGPLPGPPDRRALGCGGGLPAGHPLPRLALAPVERAVPGRRPPVRPGRSRHGPRPDAEALRQRRPLPGQPARRPTALPEHQLRHLPRRLHPVRPRLVQRSPQRGERPRQHGRHARELELELRPRRGRGGGRRGHGPPHSGRRRTSAS